MAITFNVVMKGEKRARPENQNNLSGRKAVRVYSGDRRIPNRSKPTSKHTNADVSRQAAGTKSKSNRPKPNRSIERNEEISRTASELNKAVKVFMDGFYEAVDIWDLVKPTEITMLADFTAMNEQMIAIERGWA